MKESKNSCCGAGHHSHAPYAASKLYPAISFLLLMAGIIMRYMELNWFMSSYVSLIWYLLAFLPVGLPVMREAWNAICARDYFNEFSLMAVASIGAFCIGEYPEAVAVMLFYTIGEMLQHSAVERASRNISRLLDVRPEHANVLRNHSYLEVSPKDVKVGEQIEVKPGGRIPLDGILLEECAMFDTSALTGESMPRTIQVGDEVLAGMIVYGQTVHIQTSRSYDQSALARILSLVKDASERKAPAELFIRRFARIYTPIVILLALLIVAIPALVGLFVPSFNYIFSDWLYRGLVFLVISCPCALVISVPLGYFGGIGAASRAGILFKGGNYLDAIMKVNCIAFDKTGTLTTGNFEVIEIQNKACSKQELLNIMMTVELKSTHPIAQTIVRYAQENHAVEQTMSSMKEIAGRGVEALVGEKQVLVGNLNLLKKHDIQVPEHLLKSVATVVVCAIDGVYAGAMLLADTLKEDAVQAIERLKELGIKDIYLLSGDKQEIVNQCAQDLGIQWAYGDLLPEDKAAYIEKLVHTPGCSVAFVGDGMNDAPVLALSDVGIAMGGLGSDAAIESADIVIQTDQPSKVATAITMGRITRRTVQQNIIGALGVKIIVLIAGALGFVSLWGAVFADVGVALLAVLNSISILGRKTNHR